MSSSGPWGAPVKPWRVVDAEQMFRDPSRVHSIHAGKTWYGFMLLCAGCSLDTFGISVGLGTGADSTGATSGVTDDSSDSAMSDGTTCSESGPVPWYPDVDHDSYGAGEQIQVSCEAPPNSAAMAGDCDDSASKVNPGAMETCNAVDDDCDGLTDEFSVANNECGGCALGATARAAFWACADLRSFELAEMRCRSFGLPVHLASIADKAEQDLMLALVLTLYPNPPQDISYWIGMRRAEAFWDDCAIYPESAVWEFVDGTDVGYLPWNFGQPDNLDCDVMCVSRGLSDGICLRENCAKMAHTVYGTINDIACGTPQEGYLCKAPLG